MTTARAILDANFRPSAVDVEDLKAKVKALKHKLLEKDYDILVLNVPNLGTVPATMSPDSQVVETLFRQSCRLY